MKTRGEEIRRPKVETRKKAEARNPNDPGQRVAEEIWL